MQTQMRSYYQLNGRWKVWRTLAKGEMGWEKGGKKEKKGDVPKNGT